MYKRASHRHRIHVHYTSDIPTIYIDCIEMPIYLYEMPIGSITSTSYRCMYKFWGTW